MPGISSKRVREEHLAQEKIIATIARDIGALCNGKLASSLVPVDKTTYSAILSLSKEIIDRCENAAT